MTERNDKPAAVHINAFKLLMAQMDARPGNVEMQICVPYADLDDVKKLKGHLDRVGSPNRIDRIDEVGDTERKCSFVYLSLLDFHSLVAAFAVHYDNPSLSESVRHGFAALHEGATEPYMPEVHMHYLAPQDPAFDKAVKEVGDHLEGRGMLSKPPMLRRNAGTKTNPETGKEDYKVQMSYSEYGQIQMLRMTECGDVDAARYVQSLGLVGGFDREKFVRGENPLHHPPHLRIQEAYRAGTISMDGKSRPISN